MTFSEAVEIGVAAFVAHPGAEDDVIEEHLLGQGIEKELAVRLIQFIPIAFCRFVMKSSGVVFAPEYAVMGSRGELVGKYPLESEPVFREALSYCESALQQGQGGDFFLLIAARSGGYHAVMKLLQDGAQPQGIITTPPIIQAPSQPKKKWWQFRK